MHEPKKSAFIYATIVAMGGLLFGIDAALISGAIDLIAVDFGLTAAQKGTAVSSPALGVLLALPFASFVSDRFGRKKAIISVAILYIISAFASAFATSYSMLVVARFLGGLAFTSISLASMYIGEIAPSKWRGKLVSMTQINIVIGLSAAYFINYLIHHWAGSGAEWVKSASIDTHTWQWMLGSEIPFAILWLVLLLFIPESPPWLVYRGRVDEAKERLKKLQSEDSIDAHVAEIQQSISKSSSDHSIISQMKEVFGKRMRLTLIIAMTIAIAQQTTGINAILFYAQTVFKQLGVGEDAAFSQAIWIGLVGLVFTVLGLLLVDKLGRRPLIIWGMVWIIASLGLCAFAFKQARYTLPAETISELVEIENAESLQPLVGVEFANDIAFKTAVKEAIGEENALSQLNFLVEKSIKMNAMLVLIGILSFVGAFHFSVGPVMWVLFSEIFPVSVRGAAIPFFTIVTSLTSWLVQKFFPWQLEHMGMTSIFLFYAGTVAAGLIILFFTLRETKNMSIEEIQEAMAKR